MRIYDFEGKKNISGERIREARLKLRLSQSDLAARVQVEGVTMERDSISRIEIGTRFIPDYEIPVFARVLFYKHNIKEEKRSDGKPVFTDYVCEGKIYRRGNKVFFKPAEA